MARAYSKANPQIEADRYLLQFKDYDDYLDSLATDQDVCYLQSIETARIIANLGYRSSGETLSKRQFDKRRSHVLDYLYPPYKAYELSGAIMDSSADIFLSEMAKRERANRVGILSTIIFLRVIQKGGMEITGYIDYTDSLTRRDWKPIFKGQKLLVPKKNDMGYYHWKSGEVIANDSLNYKVLQHPQKGLLFQNRFDRKTINPDPNVEPGKNTTRKRIYTDCYELCILFDHIVRQRI